MISVHCRVKSGSLPLPGCASSWACSTGRTTRDLTDTTGSPLPSAASTRIANSPTAVTRTRSRAVPGRLSRTPDQLKGITARSPPPAGQQHRAALDGRVEQGRVGAELVDLAGVFVG